MLWNDDRLVAISLGQITHWWEGINSIRKTDSKILQSILVYLKEFEIL